MGRGGQHTIAYVGSVFRNSKICQLAAPFTFIAECVSNIDVDIRDSISRAVNVKPIEICPSSRRPVRRPACAGYRENSQQLVTFLLSVQKRVDTLVF